MSKFLNIGCGTRFCIDPAWVNIDFNTQYKEVMSHDLLKGIPFEDCAFDVVYHSHLLEHLSREDGAQLINESFRVLKTGGIIRVVVPDLENICRAYLDVLERALADDVESQSKYDWIMLEMYDQAVRTEPGGEMARYLSQPDLPNKDFIIGRIGNVARDIIKSDKNLRYKNKLSKIILACKGLMCKAFNIRVKGEAHEWMYDRFSLSRLLQQAGFSDIRQCTATESNIPGWNTYFLDIDRDGFVHAPSSLYIEGGKLR